MPCAPNTPIAPAYQDTGWPLPDYQPLFHLNDWLNAVYEHEGLRLGEPPEEFKALLYAVGAYVELAMRAEGKNYPEMLALIYGDKLAGDQ